MKSSSPKRISKFLRWFCKEDFYEEFQGDLDELFQRRVIKHGRRGANFIYFFDVLTFFQPFVWKNPLSNFKFYNDIIMFNNYFKVALRVIGKYKFFSFLNITSLSLGLFPCILLLLLLQYEYSFDTFHDQSENIYRIVLDGHYKGGPFKTINTSPKLAEVIKMEFPDAGDVLRIY